MSAQSDQSNQRSLRGRKQIDSVFVDCKPIAEDFTAFESDVDMYESQVKHDDDDDDEANAIDVPSTIPKIIANKTEKKKSASKNKAEQNKKKRTKSPKSTKERPAKKKYACDKCDRVYCDRSNLSHHRLMHTGERPIKCPLCEKS